MMLAPVIPFDHITLPLQPMAVRVTLSPVQIEVELAAMVGAFRSVTLTVTALDAGLGQLSTVHTAVKVVVAFIGTLILLPVIPLDQAT